MSTLLHIHLLLLLRCYSPQRHTQKNVYSTIYDHQKSVSLNLFCASTRVFFHSMNTTSSNSSSRASRQDIHPLVRYDPGILDGGIQLLKLEYFEAETTRAPVPRNQDVPKEAFGTLTGRSILVATSHAWFYQCHPDPQGVKLKILREKFFPSLRKRFPHTEILVFDDWHSCPQWPRLTQEENKRFKKCMDHMNNVYCYCDVVLFVEAELPKLDERIYECELVPSEHEWLHFIDTIQYIRGDDDAVTIRKNDIVVRTSDVDEKDMKIEDLKKKSTRTKIFFLRRPFGRPNRTLAEDRGWLYAERITVAIRMAAAKPDTFDEVVQTNNPKLMGKILTWCEALRTAVSLDKKSIRVHTTYLPPPSSWCNYSHSYQSEYKINIYAIKKNRMCLTLILLYIY